jgi:hypothetical protein
MQALVHFVKADIQNMCYVTHTGHRRMDNQPQILRLVRLTWSRSDEEVWQYREADTEGRKSILDI